ncbi:GreA/GreB family elongation factor [Alishewanella sp. WH16-1]|mgnify:FL=1|uniref:GreA/GreB family elongation factor n=1 Tax=Alishewanella sp. WH16-1 TaxID=1651088 RepID=UPI00070C46BA|nr:GreA/GreB family elongation factor [Alishewanella sp. WH16-1]KRS21191.1 GreA/GreB family elongation factor [Alishewanella sp. WH16-1]
MPVLHRSSLQDLPLSAIERYLLRASWLPLQPTRLAQILRFLEDCPQRRARAGKPLRAAPGCTVRLIALPDGDACWVTLSADPKADSSGSVISIWSPLGQALLGKTTGEQVQVKILRRTLRFVIGDLLKVSQPG